jgi:hypothetical protein
VAIAQVPRNGKLKDLKLKTEVAEDVVYTPIVENEEDMLASNILLSSLRVTVQMECCLF